MDNVEKICDHLIMLRDGRTVLNGKVSDIRASFGRTKLYLSSPLTEEQLSSFDGIRDIHQREDGSFDLTLANPTVGEKIFTLATKDGYIPMFNQQPPTLEEIFKWKAGEPNE